MTQMLFYTKPEILNRTAHAKLRFTPLSSYAFASKATSVPIAAIEFPLVCRRYPIAFLEDAEGNVRAQAILALVEAGNSFVGDKGQWLATYVPAFVRRYPFILADMPNTKKDFAIAFDAASGCFDAEKGEPLFDEKGEPGPLLKNQMDFLSKFHAENVRTLALLKTLKEEGLLIPLNLDITRANDKARFGVRGLLAVDEKKLATLPADKAHAFLTNGLLALVYMHLVSLRNFEGIANRTGAAEDSIPWWAK